MPVTARFAGSQIARLPHVGGLSAEQRKDLADVLTSQCKTEDEARRAIDAWVDQQSSAPSRADLLTLVRSMRPGGEWRPATTSCQTCHGTGYEACLILVTRTTYQSGSAYSERTVITGADAAKQLNETDPLLALMRYRADAQLGPGQSLVDGSRRCACLPR